MYYQQERIRVRVRGCPEHSTPSLRFHPGEWPFLRIKAKFHKVKVGKDLSEPFDTVRGFRQGDPLSCDLFNFLMESVHRNGTIF